MTKRQRAQVVELLRCAADCKSLAIADVIPRPGTLAWVAWEAKRATQAECRLYSIDTDDERYRWLLLEAAQRVEEGWTP